MKSSRLNGAAATSLNLMGWHSVSCASRGCRAERHSVRVREDGGPPRFPSQTVCFGPIHAATVAPQRFLLALEPRRLLEVIGRDRPVLRRDDLLDAPLGLGIHIRTDPIRLPPRIDDLGRPRECRSERHSVRAREGGGPPRVQSQTVSFSQAVGRARAGSGSGIHRADPTPGSAARPLRTRAASPPRSP